MVSLSRRICTSVVALLLIGIGAAEATTTSWRVYQNGRWGYRIEVPRSLISQPEPQNGGGLQFRSADGRVRLDTYGSFDFDDAQDLKATQNDAEWDWIGTTGRVTYRANGANWFVSTGITSDGRIFYQRYEQRHIGNDTSCHIAFSITYPQTLRSTWNPNTTRIAKSFTVPKGDCQG